MDRKFVIALSSLAGSMMLTEAHAIGLGDIKLRSSLNEPLRADIKLVQVKDLSENEVLVNLAPKADFDNAGVDRDFLLTSLRFRLDLDDPKNPKVVVTTQQPIREPFLNFLVEVQWPSGRLLREYTLLLDLPAFDTDGGSSGARNIVPAGRALPADEGVSEVSKGRRAAEPATAPPAPRVAEPAASKPEGVKVRRATRDEIGGQQAPAAEAPVPAASRAEPAVAIEPRESAQSADSYGPTNPNDTLWSIAKRVQNGGTVHQNMIAIQRLNPAAFVNGNINQMKKGQVLKLPSQEEISSIGRGEAVAAVNEQNNAWKSSKTAPAQAVAGSQLDATGRAPAEAAVAPPAEGQLKLAAPAETPAESTGKGAGDQQAAAEVQALQGQLTTDMEELDRAQRENQELNSRVKDLDGQIDSAERLLQLQNEEMAAMQAKLAAEQKAKTEADAAAAANAQANADAAAAAEAKAKADAEAQVAAAAEAQAKADAEAKAAADAKAKADAEAQAAVVAAEAQAKADAEAQAAAQAAQQPSTAVEPAVSLPAESQVSASEAVLPQEQPVVEQQPVEAQAVADAPAPMPQPVPAAEEPASEQTPAVAEENALLSTPVIGGIAAIVAFVLALFGYRKFAAGRAQEVEESAEDTEDTGIDYEPVALAPAAVEAAEEPVVEEEPVVVAAAAVISEPEAPKAETGDVLGEADIYISFGNFEKGEALLASAIRNEPNRVDYRLKLLELYKEADNLSAFDVAYKDLAELDDDVATARAAEMRPRISGADAVPLAFGVSAAAAAVSEEIDLDFDLDLDSAVEPTAVEAPLSEDDFGLGGGVVESATADESVAADALDLDFDLDLDSAVSAPEPAAELDFDLGDDFAAAESIDADVAEPVAEVPLDLDFDLDFDTAAAAPVAAELSAVAAPTEAEVELEEPEQALLDAVTADAGDIDEDLDFLTDADEAATKLDLARAYIDMGDKDGARDILAEVLEEGNGEQKREAQALLDSIG